MKKFFTILTAALISVFMNAEVIVFHTVCSPSSNVTFTEGSVTLNASCVIADGLFLNNRDMSASITNSDTTTLITKLEMVPSFWPQNHATVRANNTAPTTSSQELIVFDNINSNSISLYADCQNIQVNEISVTLSDALTLNYEHVKIGDLYYNFDTTSLTAAVTWEKNADTLNYHGLQEANIPASVKYGVNTYAVKAVEANAFGQCDALKKIVIPEGITTIGRNGFRQCEHLESVVIPSSVTEIGDNAFYLCYGVNTLSLGTGVKTIGEHAFGSLRNVGELIIPDNVESIGHAAFSEFHKATKISIGSGVKHLGERAFQNCNSLPAFEVAAGNTIVCVEDGVLFNMAKDTLLQCPGAKAGEYVAPSSVKTVYDGSFIECEHLTSVELPEGVTYIGAAAFSSCTSLKEFVVPNTVTFIGGTAFAHCTALEKLTLGSGVQTIGQTAFVVCSSLKQVISYAVTPPETGMVAFMQTPVDQAVLYVPQASVGAYRQADTWKDFGTIAAISESGEEVQTINGTINYLDKEGKLLRSKQLTLHLPAAPVIAGFTFLNWQVAEGALKDGITVQAVYRSDEPTAAPEVYTNPANRAQKLIRNGSVYILTTDHTYTVFGAEVR